jgi:myosin heavy subunit
MKKAVFIFVVLFGCNFLQAQTPNKNQDKTIEELWKMIETLEHNVIDLNGKYSSLKVKYDSMLNVKNADIARLNGIISNNKRTIQTLENTLKSLRNLNTGENLDLQTNIANLQKEMGDLQKENKELKSEKEKIQNPDTDSVSLANRKQEIKDREKQLELANKEIARLKSDVIDGIIERVIFNGTVRKFKTDVLFYPTKAGSKIINLSIDDENTLKNFVELANRTPKGIKIVVVGRYARGEDTKQNAGERARYLAEILQKKGLNVELEADTDLESNMANNERIGVGIYVKGKILIKF